jgi:hypothetical protein
MHVRMGSAPATHECDAKPRSGDADPHGCLRFQAVMHDGVTGGVNGATGPAAAATRRRIPRTSAPAEGR